jgi:transposase
MEACGGAQHWARELRKLGHEPRIMAAEFVAPYRQGGKNDANDAAAICEAVSRPKMRFVAIKSVEQQAVLAVHRLRQGLVEERTALANRLRGLLTEYGQIVASGLDRLRCELPAMIEDGGNAIPGIAREVFADAATQLRELDTRIAVYDRRIAVLARASDPSQRSMKIEGGRSPRRRWSLASAMPRCSTTAANSPPGWESRHDSIPTAASSVSAS